MQRKYEISQSHITALSDSSDRQAIILDDMFDEQNLQQLLIEIQKITDSTDCTTPILTPAKIGILNSNLSLLRGDLTCWVTSDLCSSLSMTTMKALIQSMIKIFKCFQEELSLVPDYSVQFASYVSTTVITVSTAIISSLSVMLDISCIMMYT